jgi:hypothetical protein
MKDRKDEVATKDSAKSILIPSGVCFVNLDKSGVSGGGELAKALVASPPYTLLAAASAKKRRCVGCPTQRKMWMPLHGEWGCCRRPITATSGPRLRIRSSCLSSPRCQFGRIESRRSFWRVENPIACSVRTAHQRSQYRATRVGQ